MNLITLENICKNYGDRQILNNISVGINEGEKIGVIGINGTGKSTFLKIVAGLEIADSGNIISKNNIVIESLLQNPDYDLNSTVIEQVFNVNTREMKLLGEYETLLNITNPSDDDSNRIVKLQEQITNLNLWDKEAEAKTILTKLGINDFSKKVGELSGGQRKRISLASALITPCELLILDEPTNHMDSETIAWMEDYLNKRKGSLLMITHDRYFLDRVSNRILEIDEGNLYSYEGNYSVFLEKKAEREEVEFSTQRKKRNLYRRELAWIKRGAKARSTKQKARIDRFTDLKDNMSSTSQESLELAAMQSRLGKKIIELENINKSYDDLLLIKDFSYRLLRDDRIGIVGPNGIGKSTLMNIIAGKVNADSGTIEIGETVKIGMFTQENFHMDEEMKVIDYIKEVAEFLPLADGTKISASKMLENFLFRSEVQYKPIGNLSGGERRRLNLMRVLMGAPNILILDEPTNDLDTITLSLLEEFIENFGGSIITVSHDRYFLDKVCNNIFAYEGNGKIEKYNGNYSDYLEVSKAKIKEEPKEKPKKEKSIPKSTLEKKEEKVRFSYNEKREYDTIDEIISDLEEKLEAVEMKLSKETSDYVKINNYLQEKEDIELKLLEKMEKWEYLNNIAEKLKK